ncbi:uncharacterized protein LY89DRAFT_679217 [Mollisia scopiformis]|uniref:GRF-type domain-containing protein n=1 Tax=Mollisia scopiformis TaxID=149040 RepID=A0A194XV99_MOLSC|nr:uncharacterized protein LY89DRAFT_679217 [Mollisia scopiformis]KUJ23944.1 hypothetical protein LY89DRAFT_679217 [Mollisia scopiformis]
MAAEQPNVVPESVENPENAPEHAPRPKFLGRVQDGKFYCECDGMSHKARCRTVTQETSNKGRKFWLCHKEGQGQCKFYVWVDDEEEVKEWLEENGPPPRAPETPRDKGKGKEVDRSKATPWTLSKRKRGSDSGSREVSDEENGGPSGANGNEQSDAAEFESDELVEVGDGSPSRKAPRRTMLDTPGQVLEERLNNAAATLPTPDTGKKPEAEGVASGSRTSKQLTLASARLGDVIDLTEDTPSALTIAVMDELHSAKVRLNDSTKAYIGHLIDSEIDQHDAKMRRNQKTISKMKKRLDELESLVLALTGDDPVQLSD